MGRIRVAFSREEMQKLGLMVICEGWEKRKFGNVRVRYLDTFNEKERDQLFRNYPKIHNWCLVKGFPDEVIMETKTYFLLQKACNFFGTI